MIKIIEFIVNPVKTNINKFSHQISEINKKYAVPHIKTTRMVNVSLFILRIYLILLVCILFYKFTTLL